jgi:hypothetical protein
MHHITRRLSPSLIVAIAALFVALAGSAIAAGEIITSPDQIKDKVITEPKLADGAVNTRALAERGVGLADLAQPTVAAGVSAGVLPDGRPFLINPTTDVSSVEGPQVDAQSNGTYTVRFANPVRHCQWTATKAAITGSGGAPAFFNVRPSQFDTREVFVFARQLITVGSNKGTALAAPTSFYLIGRC